LFKKFGEGSFYNHRFLEIFPIDVWLFLYNYHFFYVSGPPIQKELSLASKLSFGGPLENPTKS
jgi:hypothetical protein